MITMSETSMKWVLAAVDGSEPARIAAIRAAAMATRLGEGLALLYVVEPPSVTAGVVAPIVEMVDEHRTWARDYLAGLAQTLKSPALEVRTQISEGSPVEEVCRAAEAHDIDLVAVGSRGLGALERLLLGSVATRLGHTCPKPLLIIREAPQGR